MASSSPEPGPGSTLQRILPLVVLGISFLLIFQLFPQFFGGAPPAAPTPTDSLAQVTPSPAATPPPDDSTRTRVWNTVLVNPLESGLRFLANDLNLGAGSAIILFTIFVRMALLPLSIQQIRSQKSMQALQPELKALQKKYAKDKEKLSVETMALYKQHGVNPAAGCFPILLQMPVLFGLYAALSNLGTQELAENQAFLQPWFWVEHLNQPDIIIIGGVTLPFVLPVLAALTQWIQQRMMTQPTEDPQQKLQNQMFQFMPLMMLWFGLSFSAGLALYWVTQNIIGIIQQYFSTGLGSLATLLPNRGSAATGTVRGAGGAAGASATARAPRLGKGDAGKTDTGRDGSRDGAQDGSRDGGSDGGREGGRDSGGKRDAGKGNGTMTRGTARSRTGPGEGRRTSGKR